MNNVLLLLFWPVALLLCLSLCEPPALPSSPIVVVYYSVEWPLWSLFNPSRALCYACSNSRRSLRDNCFSRCAWWIALRLSFTAELNKVCCTFVHYTRSRATLTSSRCVSSGCKLTFWSCIKVTYYNSCGMRNTTLSPRRPIRAVRPIRWINVLGSIGGSNWTTVPTYGISNPRAATSVQTKTHRSRLVTYLCIAWRFCIFICPCNANTAIYELWILLHLVLLFFCTFVSLSETVVVVVVAVMLSLVSSLPIAAQLVLLLMLGLKSTLCSASCNHYTLAQVMTYTNTFCVLCCIKNYTNRSSFYEARVKA